MFNFTLTTDDIIVGGRATDQSHSLCYNNHTFYNFNIDLHKNGAGGPGGGGRGEEH